MNALGTDYFQSVDSETPPVFKKNTPSQILYDISFESDIADSKTVMPSAAKLSEGDKYVFGADLAASGFEFAGWKVKGETDGKLYKADDEFTMPNKSVEFEAQWELKKSVISADNTSLEYGTGKINLTCNNPTFLQGRTYQWYTDGQIVEGATSFALELSNAADSGSYTVVVSYKGYSATSAACEISISKAQPSLNITPSATALDGGGKVTFDVTASNVPEGAQIGVSCDDTNLAVSKVDDGKFEATLPDATKTYTFTAAYDGDDNYEAASAQCSVAVTATPSPAPAPTPKPEHKHTAVAVAGKAATCTQVGLSDGSKCSECGEVIEAQKSIPALGHAWGEWVVTTPATVFAAGIETSTCTRPGCGAIQTRSIAKLSSVTVTSGSVTCSFDGKTVTVTKAAKGKKVIVIPAKIKVAGKWYKVTKIKASAFKGSKATTMIVKSKSLTKKGVKNCLKGSKVSTIKIKVAKSKKVNAKYLAKYKRFFAKKNSGKKAAIR